MGGCGEKGTKELWPGCARVHPQGWGFLPQGLGGQSAGVHTWLCTSREGAEAAGGRQTIFKGLLRFDRRLRLTRMPGRKGQTALVQQGNQASEQPTQDGISEQSGLEPHSDSQLYILLGRRACQVRPLGPPWVPLLLFFGFIHLVQFIFNRRITLYSTVLVSAIHPHLWSLLLSPDSHPMTAIRLGGRLPC